MKLILSFLLLISWSLSAGAVTIPMVTVGNPGNAPDTRYGIDIGSVANAFQIAKYEVTAGQYTEFLNAVAKADPNGLYNPAMFDAGATAGANIKRLGGSPNYTYLVAADWANRPVNFVSFWDAARFANWLHNGQPTGAQGPGTTEGGAYHNIGNDLRFGRNADARFFIPSENEWYKAAYHKNDGVTGNYWNYPTASDTKPNNTLPDEGNHANFYVLSGAGTVTYTIGPPYYRTEPGAFANSASPYGTFDQGGNVWEWNETKFSSSRGLRGGAYNSFAGDSHTAAYRIAAPADEVHNIGFRVASIFVPEPSSAILTVGIFAALAAHRRRRG